MLTCTFVLTVGLIAAEEPVGQRPYEMVWANRTEDDHPPLVDFENLDGWSVEAHNAVATLVRSREQQLWGRYVGKLTYRGTGSGPRVTLRPPEPIPIEEPFDCVNFWLYGNNWAWVPDPTTPQVGVHVLFRGAKGQEVRVSLGNVRWREWWVMHRQLSPEQVAALKEGATLVGLEFTNGRNKEDRVLFLDNLSVYQEQLPPLNFEPRPKRGVDPFPGQSPGLNTGPGRLPFPTREETILPDNLTEKFETRLEGPHPPASSLAGGRGGAFVFTYRGADGTLTYRYTPATGTLSDVTVQWEGRGEVFQPLADGGVLFATDAGTAAPEKLENLSCERVGETVVARWRLTLGERTAEVTYTFRLWQKSLVVDVKCLGGEIGEFRIGRAVGVENPRLVTLPYLTFRANRPAVLVTGPPERPLFISAYLDWYRSNASRLFAVNRLEEGGATYNGGSTYIPKTDGQRNDCFERLFLTVSPRFEEVLPNIPNPKSPWMHLAGERLWRAHGASNRERDYAHWAECARYGMTKVVITDHETGWRDGGESFTLRTRAAPGKGGDEGQREYARKLHALGFRYGIYNNYTDFAPVNEHWNEDYVTRLPNGDWQPAWPRCYNLKPSRAVELEAKLAPIIQEKFHLSTAYCDVHTAVAPWHYCDYDARVPGAGTFAATFYAYGEIMLHQKQTWNGPVYSEGSMHWMYCGLTDGNYGQDQEARLPVNPWLVDFDLRKMHPLCCNFGMGNLGMFYGRREGLGRTPEEREARLDRFLAATVAFGHTGFLVYEGGIKNAVRSYFLLQQLHAHYAQETAVDIRYANEQGELLDSTAAVATGAYRRNQIATRYSNGLLTLVNGHPRERWHYEDGKVRFDLPPNGYVGLLPAEGGEEPRLFVFSGEVDGHRADYVDSPAYLYADGRGTFTRFPKVASDGAVIAHRRFPHPYLPRVRGGLGGVLEVIPVGECRHFGVSLDGRTATAVALDKAGEEMGPAETRFARGLVYVLPREGAFSYLLTPGEKPAVVLRCERDEVVPGETVVVEGRERHEFRIPPAAEPGTRLWQQFEGAWIDFTLVPLAKAKLTLDGPLRLTLTSNLSQPAEGTATLAGQERAVRLEPGRPTVLDFPLPPPEREEVRPLPFTLRLGDLSYERTWWLKAERGLQSLVTLPEEYETGQCIRGGTEQALGGDTGALVRPEEMSCGQKSKRGLFMHPPYRKGVGYSFARFAPLKLPAQPPAAFRCAIGKRDGSDPGDGILFRVAVVDERGQETVVAEKQWIEHAWTDLEADLAPWAGQKVRVKLIADVGPEDNPVGDWACWAEMRIESREPVLGMSVHEERVSLRFEEGPYPVAGLTAGDLRAARRGWLHFEGIGLQHGAPYISTVALNGVPLGELPEAGGNEREDIWSEMQSVPLSPEAIASLRAVNQATIDNPGQDCFKVRRFWVELELADGRKCSSKVETRVYTQPPTWLYAEGIGVPFGEQIAVEIRFDLESGVE